jgi:hypothetical protein
MGSERGVGALETAGDATLETSADVACDWPGVAERVIGAGEGTRTVTLYAGRPVSESLMTGAEVPFVAWSEGLTSVNLKDALHLMCIVSNKRR